MTQDSYRGEKNEFGAIIYQKKNKKYSYTKFSVGDAHSCNPMANYKKVPSKAMVCAAIHTHPNSNSFSEADRNFVEERGMPLYLVTPNGTLRYYHDTRRGHKDEVIYENLKYDKLSKKRQRKLVDKYEDAWNTHIQNPCDFNCVEREWPTW